MVSAPGGRFRDAGEGRSSRPGKGRERWASAFRVCLLRGSGKILGLHLQVARRKVVG
jgi:hypothetical protein